MDWLSRLDGGLKLQNYRRVAHETLTEAGDIDFGAGIPADLESGLSGIQNVNDWKRIGEQLALLKRLPNLRGVYLAARGKAAKLVVICEISGNLATASSYRPSFDFSWPCARSLEPYLKDYELSPQLMELLKQLVDKYGGSNAALIKAAVDWLVVALHINASTGGPNGAFICACHAGMDEDLVRRLNSPLWHSDFQKRVERLSFVVPSMQGLGWNTELTGVEGRAELALDKAGLEAALRI